MVECDSGTFDAVEAVPVPVVAIAVRTVEQDNRAPVAIGLREQHDRIEDDVPLGDPTDEESDPEAEVLVMLVLSPRRHPPTV